MLHNASFIAVVAEYAAWLDTLGFSSGVVYDYKFRIRDFFGWLESQNIQALTLLTQKHIDTYFKYLQTRPNKRRKGSLSTAHLNHNFAAVDKLLEFLQQHGFTNVLIPTLHRIKPDKQTRINRIEILTQEEIKTLYGCIDNAYSHFSFKHREAKQYQLRLIFALYYGCGLRRREGSKIKTEDIDFDRRTVFIEKGKGYKDRIVPMSAGVYTALQDYVYNFRQKLKLPHKRLFIVTSGCLNDSLQYLQSICDDEAIKAKRLSLHVLRHSIATHLLQNGMSIENIALFLGHSTLESTQVYTHVAAAQ